MTSRTRQNWAARSDTGRVRSHNEDAILTDPPLFVVADGLGGHEAGEVASQLAVETLRDHAPRRPDANALARAVRAANKEVIRAAREGIGRAGMGTTITAALIEGTHIVIAQVGDSRAYLMHAGSLSRVTEDHSMVADLIRLGQITEAQSRVHPNRSVITRALGTDPNMYADTFQIDAQPGDRLLLCSDGLTSMLLDEGIAQILRANSDPGMAADALIASANEAGGQDNISVIVVDLEGTSRTSRGPREGERKLRSVVSILAWVFAAALLIAGIGYGTYAYAHSQAYLITENDRVVLYRGVPGSLGDFSLSWRLRISDVPASQLSPGQQSRLRDGARFGSVSEAEEALQGYEEQIVIRNGTF